MTELQRPYRDAHPIRGGAAIVLEYAFVLALILLVGVVVVAEVSGAMDGFIHSISFVV